MGGLFSSEQAKTKYEKERDNRQSYLASKHFDLIKDIQNKIMLLDVEHRNNQTLICSLINCMSADLNNFENVQNSLNEPSLLDETFEEWKEKKRNIICMEIYLKIFLLKYSQKYQISDG